MRCCSLLDHTGWHRRCQPDAMVLMELLFRSLPRLVMGRCCMGFRAHGGVGEQLKGLLLGQDIHDVRPLAVCTTFGI